MTKHTSSIIVLLLFAPLLSCNRLGSPGDRSWQAPTNRELVIGITQEFENLNPVIMTMSATSYIYGMVGRTLSTMDENARWIPKLAEEIPTFENHQAQIITENGKKKVQAHWRIREEARWGDGIPVTCEDVKFSWEVAQSEFVSVGEKETYSQIEKIIISPQNPKHCTFIYSPARWSYLQLGTFYLLPRHLEASIFAEHGKKPSGYEQNSLYVTNPTNPGLYHGPYLISEIKLGSHVMLKRNPYFYGPPAKIEKIIIKLIPNTGTLEANLRSNTIQMIGTLGMSFDQALAFEAKVAQENLPFQVEFRPSLTYEHLDFNLDHPILKDQRVRQALLYAIDRQGLTVALFAGKQIPALYDLAPIDPWFTNDGQKIKLYPFSRRQAQRLLEQANWPLAADGFRYKDGQKLQFSLMTTAGNRVRELVQVYLKDQWRSIGVDVSIKNEPARVFFGETTRKRKFPGLAMYAWVSSPEKSPRSTLHSSSIPTPENGFSGQNTPGWRNGEVDHLIDQLEVEFNAQRRLEISQKIAYQYTNDLPAIPLYYRSDVAVRPKNLIGMAIPGHQFSETNHVERWDLLAPTGSNAL